MKKGSAFTQVGFQLLQVGFTLLVALIMGAIMMTLSGKNAMEAYRVLFGSALGSKTAIANTLLASTPLIFAGLGAAIAFRAGVFNVGVEGSIYIGAFTSAWVGFTFVNLPGYFLVPLALLAAAITGGLWCYFPGVLKARLDVDEIVSTIMLNYVAVLFTSYLVNYPFRLPGLANAMSAEVAPQARLARLSPPSQMNISFLIAVAAAIILAFVVKHMRLGFELRTVGDNPLFARWSGMPVPKVIESVMFISGLFGGLAGAGQALGVNYRFIAGFSPGYAFTGIAIALLARNSPIGTLIAALLFGILRSGSSTMEIFTDVPRDLITVLEATVIFFAALEFSFGWLKRRRRGSAH
ncbi:MAG: ABC transporter permease [Chloroflexi bacterium]|nr:ABC transporter permease [Chloroflexota bacterium]